MMGACAHVWCVCVCMCVCVCVCVCVCCAFAWADKREEGGLAHHVHAHHVHAHHVHAHQILSARPHETEFKRGKTRPYSKGKKRAQIRARPKKMSIMSPPRIPPPPPPPPPPPSSSDTSSLPCPNSSKPPSHTLSASPFAPPIKMGTISTVLSPQVCVCVCLCVCGCVPLLHGQRVSVEKVHSFHIILYYTNVFACKKIKQLPRHGVWTERRKCTRSDPQADTQRGPEKHRQTHREAQRNTDRHPPRKRVSQTTHADTHTYTERVC
jgi:hypothetical protein